MKKIKSIVFVSLLTFLSSCDSDVFQEHEIGDNLIDKSTEVFLIDTFTVHSSTVKMDSVQTSNFPNVLFGKYKDPYFGTIRSDFYGEVNLGGSFKRSTINETVVDVKFDSLVFIAYHDSDQKRFYGDTLPEQSMAIHRLIEEFKLPSNKYSYKGHDVLLHDIGTLADTTFFPEPIRNGILDEENDKDAEAKRGGLRIKMDDALGLDIIDKVNNDDDIVLESDQWLEYFKGIVLKAGDENTALFSFQTGNGMKMRLYYSDIAYENAGEAQFHDFPINPINSTKNEPVTFSNYTSDFISDSTYMQQFDMITTVENDLSSELTDNLSFIQGGVGLITKLRIPHIENLNRMGLTGGILKAELVFSPQEDSYDVDLFPLPFTNFSLFKTDKRNLIMDGVIDPATSKAVSSTYVLNPKYIDESYYSFDVTNYVNQILLMGQEYDDALLISFPIINISQTVTLNTIGNSMERLVIDNNPKSDTRIKLKVTYVVQK